MKAVRKTLRREVVGDTFMAERGRDRRQWAIARRWLRIAAVGIFLCSIAQLAAATSHLIEIVASFQVQVLVAGLVVLAAQFFVRDRWWIAVSIVPLLWSAFNVLPWYWGAEDVDQSPSVRLMLFNVLQENSNRAEVVAEIERWNPDFLVLLECDEKWYADVEPLFAALPHHMHVPGSRLRGTALLSRFALQNVQVLDLNNPMSRSVTLKIDTDGHALHVMVTHPWPPVWDLPWRSRNEQLSLAAEVLAAMPEPRVLLGDLNTTMWSPCYRELEHVSGLHNARRGFGIQPTFPMDRLMLLRVPIDHVLVDDAVRVVNHEVGNASGSDHAPIIVDLVIPSTR